MNIYDFWLMEKKAFSLKKMKDVFSKRVLPLLLRNAEPNFFSPGAYSVSPRAQAAIMISRNKGAHPLTGKSMTSFEKKNFFRSPEFKSLLATSGQALPENLKEGIVLEPRMLKKMVSIGFDESLGKTDVSAPSLSAARVLKRIFGLHEADELVQLRKKKEINRFLGGGDYSDLFFSHANPQVLLNEHNMISTLDDPMVKKEVVDFVRRMRGNSGETAILDKYIPGGYATGERISRHKRKSISPLIFKEDLEKKKEILNRLSEEMRRLGMNF